MLNKVYLEEKTEIEKAKALSLKNQSKPTQFADTELEQESSSESSDPEAEPKSQKVVDRLKKKTKKELRR